LTFQTAAIAWIPPVSSRSDPRPARRALYRHVPDGTEGGASYPARMAALFDMVGAGLTLPRHGRAGRGLCPDDTASGAGRVRSSQTAIAAAIAKTPEQGPDLEQT
jgi:hypothetical protein